MDKKLSKDPGDITGDINNSGGSNNKDSNYLGGNDIKSGLGKVGGGSITSLSSGESAPFFEKSQNIGEQDVERQGGEFTPNLEKERMVEISVPEVRNVGDGSGETEKPETQGFDVEKTPKQPNIVDRRTNNEKTRSVSEDSTHKLTETADEEEEDFINHVEEVHSII